MKREEWWTIAIRYPDGYGGQRSFDTREEAERAARENERLGFGAGDEKMRGRIVISHHVRVIEDWAVPPETVARVVAEDAKYAERRMSKKRVKLS